MITGEDQVISHLFLRGIMHIQFKLLVHLEIRHQRCVPCTHLYLPSFWISCALYSLYLRNYVLELVQAQRRVTSTMKCVVSHMGNN